MDPNDSYQVIFVIDERLCVRTDDQSRSVERSVNIIRCTLLKILTHFRGAGREDRLQWGFKFFPSDRSVRRRCDAPRFREFTLKHFEEFENELEARFATLSTEPVDSDLDVIDKLKPELRALLRDFPWDRPDILSPVKPLRSNFTLSGRRKSGLVPIVETSNPKQNFAFVVAECPDIIEDMDSEAEDTAALLRSFLPNDIRREFVETYGIHLFWIDMKVSAAVQPEAASPTRGCRLIDSALRAVDGRLLPVSTVTSCGSLHDSYLGSLVKIADESSEKDAHPTSLQCAIPLFPVSSVMRSFLDRPRQPSLPSSSSDLSATLLFGSDCCSPSSVSFRLTGRSMTMSPAAEFSGTELVLSCLAMVAAGDLPLSCRRTDAVFLVAEEMSAVTGIQMDLTGCERFTRFSELLLQLSQLSRVLLVECGRIDAVSMSHYAVVQPLTVGSAVLTFLHPTAAASSAVAASVSSPDRPASHGMLSSELISNVVSQLPELNTKRAAKREVTTKRYQLAATRFTPALLETWYRSEAVASASVDSLVASLSTGLNTNDDEMKLLRNLRKTLMSPPKAARMASRSTPSKDGSRKPADLPPDSGSAIEPAFTSPNRRRLAKQKSPAVPSRISPRHRNPERLRSPSQWKSSAVERPRRESPRKVVAGRSKTMTPAKNVGKHPAVGVGKKTLGITGRTPRKGSSQTPRKSNKLTPGKVARSKPRRRTPPKATGNSAARGGVAASGGSGAMWRANLILQKSREAMARKSELEEIDEEASRSAMSTTASVRLLDAQEQFTTTGWTELSSEDELIKQLKVAYDKVVEGEGTPLIGAKSIVTSAVHFYRNRGELDVPESIRLLLEKHLISTNADLRDKYKGREDGAAITNKFTEYQLQVLLRLEMEAQCGTGLDSETTEQQSRQIDELVAMLRAMSFVKDPGFLSIYLAEVLLANYVGSAARFLYRIYSELVQPIPAQLEYLQTPDTIDAEQSVPLPSANPFSSFPMSSTDSAFSATQTGGAGHTRKLCRNPTFSTATQRQIQVQLPAKKPSASQEIPAVRRSTRIASASKLNKTLQSADASETKKVRRMLFDADDATRCGSSDATRRMSLPLVRAKSTASLQHGVSQTARHRTPRKPHHVLKTRVVSETPAHKQGHNLLMKLEMRRRRLQQTIDADDATAVVAESPLKDSIVDAAARVATDASKVDVSSFLRRESFYNSDKLQTVGIATKYTKLEERMTQRVFSPPHHTVCETYVAGSWLTSPRRITPKALFGGLLSPSPDKKKVRPEIPSTSTLPETPNKIDGATPRRTFSRELNFAGIFSPRRRVPMMTFGDAGFDSPSRHTRRQSALVQEDSLQSTGFESVGLEAAAPFCSPSRNTRLQARMSLKSPPSSSRAKTQLCFDRNHPKSETDRIRKVRMSFSGALETNTTTQNSASSRLRNDSASGNSTSSASNSEARLGLENPAIAAENIRAQAAVTTPLSKEKRIVKTPDSLDKWPRRKNRFLMGPSPPISVSVTLDQTRVSTGSEAGPTRRTRRTSKSELLSPDRVGEAASCSVVEDDKGRSVVVISRKRRRSSGSKNASEVKRLRTTAVRPMFGKPVDLFTEEDIFDPVNMAPSGRGFTASAVAGSSKPALRMENYTPFGSTRIMSPVIDRFHSSSLDSEFSNGPAEIPVVPPSRHTLSTKHSSGFQSGGPFSELETSLSPVYPTTFTARNVADKFVPAPVSSVIASNTSCRTTPNTAAGISVAQNSAGRRFSPGVSQTSIMHLVTSPLLETDVAGSKVTLRSLRRSTATKRCLDQQLLVAAAVSAPEKIRSFMNIDEDTLLQ